MKHNGSKSVNQSNSNIFLDNLCRIESYILVILLVSIALFVFFEVVMRSIGIAIDGIEEFSSLLLVWLIYGGVALAETKQQHLQVSLPTETFPRVIRVLITFVSKLSMLILIVFIVIGEIEVIIGTAGVRTTVLDWPVILWYLSVFVGFVMIGIHFIISESARIGRFLGGRN